VAGHYRSFGLMQVKENEHGYVGIDWGQREIPRLA
jgi:hypothetical protein